MSHLYKDFPPGWGHLRVPMAGRRSAMAGLTLHAACTGRALLAQRAAWLAVAVLGARILPGKAHPWLPLDRGLWASLKIELKAEVGEFDTIAGYQRIASSRTGHSLLLIRKGVPIAFLKMQYGDAGGREIVAEERALRMMARGRPQAFEVPEVLSSGSIGEWEYVCMSAFPPRIHRPATLPPLDEIVTEIDSALDSWPRSPDVPPHWRPMHGDLTPWNLREAMGRLFLIDWEHVKWAPPHADKILYRIAAAATGVSRGLAPWIPDGDSVEAIRYWILRAEGEWRGSNRDDRFAHSASRILRAMELEAVRAGGATIHSGNDGAEVLPHRRTSTSALFIGSADGE